MTVADDRHVPDIGSFIDFHGFVPPRSGGRLGKILRCSVGGRSVVWIRKPGLMRECGPAARHRRRQKRASAPVLRKSARLSLLEYFSLSSAMRSLRRKHGNPATRNRKTHRSARTLPRKPQMLPQPIFRAQGSPSPLAAKFSLRIRIGQMENPEKMRIACPQPHMKPENYSPRGPYCARLRTTTAASSAPITPRSFRTSSVCSGGIKTSFLTYSRE